MKDYDIINSIGYCSYCKSEIYSNDEYDEKNYKIWCKGCEEQMNTYVDIFGDNHKYGR